jgi:tetratricopeptide (TPR) repeat protein
VDALNALGITYARAGRPARAVAVFERILALDPRNAMALQNIGSAHLTAGRFDAAREAFRRSIAINPEWAASYTGLGAAELQLGHRQAAIDAWKRAVTLNPADFDALFNLGTELVNDRQFDAARRYLERFVTSAPRSAYGRDITRIRALLDRLPRSTGSR